MSRCSTQPPIPTSLRPLTLDLIMVWINRHRNPNSRFTRSLSTAPVDLGSRESTGGDSEGGSPTPPFPLLGERRGLKCRALLEPPVHILRSPPRPISWVATRNFGLAALATEEINSGANSAIATKADSVYGRAKSRYLLSKADPYFLYRVSDLRSTTGPGV